MAVKGNISNSPNGVIGHIKADINVYHGVETDSAKVTIDNKTKKIKVDVKEEFLDNKQDKLIAGENITIDENNVISATGGGSEVIPNPEVVGDEPLLNSIEIDGDKFKINNEDSVYHEGEGILIDEQNNISVDKEEIQEKLISGTNIKTINDQTLLGHGNIDIQGSEPFIYNEVNEGGDQEISLPKNTITIYKNINLTSLTINFTETYLQKAGWISEVTFRNNYQPTLTINPLEGQTIKYIQFGGNTNLDSVKEHLSVNAAIDMIFYYDGINTICYVSEVLD